MNLISALAVVISIAGVLYFLIACALLCLLIWGLKYLAGLMGWSIPQPAYAIIGFILFCLLCLYALGLFGGAGVSFR